jgi:hypothetical protein
METSLVTILDLAAIFIFFCLFEYKKVVKNGCILALDHIRG